MKKFEIINTRNEVVVGTIAELVEIFTIPVFEDISTWTIDNVLDTINDQNDFPFCEVA